MPLQAALLARAGSMRVVGAGPGAEAVSSWSGIPPAGRDEVGHRGLVAVEAAGVPG